ncbi:hypothetical protein AKJ16_DCAP01644 [Drosera capensis]
MLGWVGFEVRVWKISSRFNRLATIAQELLFCYEIVMEASKMLDLDVSIERVLKSWNLLNWHLVVMAVIRFPDRITFSGLWPGAAIRSPTAAIEMSKQQALSSMELLCRRARSTGIDAFNGQSPRLRFRLYVGKVPWHTGVRAFLSQLFPRYGHYCGPNWSSGKDRGSLIWDKRPID